MKIIVNGKFLRVPSTGVHRVAAELANALASLVEERHPAVAGLDFVLWTPFDGVARADAIALPQHIVGPLTGIPWEQVTLPLRKGRSLLLNLCNIGPVLSRNAVTMIHDVQVHLSPQSYSRGFRWWYRLIQPAFARRHRMLLTVSEFSKREIIALGLAPAERIAVIPNGVDHVLRQDRDPLVLDRLAITAGHYVLALATTQAHKNIALLMRVFAGFGPDDPQLVLFGGDDIASFRRAGIEVPANVVFAGRVSDAALRTLMENALCLAFPSTTEGFGLPPLEAMRLGCPAIVAPCGALPEICGDAALYAGPDDSEAWAAAIRKLAHDLEYRESVRAASRTRAEAYNWRDSAVMLADVLQRQSGKALNNR